MEQAARPLLIVLLAGAGLAHFVLLQRQRSNGGSLAPGCWWAVPYWLGALVCVFAFMRPEAEWRRALWEGGPMCGTLATVLGAALMSVGVVVWLVLLRRGRLTGSLAAGIGPPLVVLVAVCLAGLPRLIPHPAGFFVVPCLVFVALASWVAYAWVRFRNSPSERMARLINQGRSAEARAIGESVPPEGRDLAVQHNLAAACCNTGDLVRAKWLFTEIAGRPDLTEHHRADIDEWLRKIAELESPVSESQ
jgi:preprotein translocase subunit SecG